MRSQIRLESHFQTTPDGSKRKKERATKNEFYYCHLTAISIVFTHQSNQIIFHFHFFLGSREVTFDVRCSRGSRSFKRENQRTDGSHQSVGGWKYNFEGECESRDAERAYDSSPDCRFATNSSPNISSTATKLTSTE